MVPKSIPFIAFFFLFHILGCSSFPQEKQKEKPQDAQSAVGSVVNSIRTTQVAAKYCPLCGKHYSSKLESCPQDGTKLRNLEE